MISLLLTPLLVLVFALLHAVYHLASLARQAKINITQVIARPPKRPAASFHSLEDLLTVHGCPSSAVRVPNHLAVVIADAAPSSIRLYISTLFSRSLPKDDPWREFRSGYQAAVEAKHANDMASMVHLARVSGVQQLSIYTSQPLSASALQSLRKVLQIEYKTKALLLPHQQQHHQHVEAQSEPGWSKYAELRRRTRSMAKGGDSTSPSSTGSSASSDSEAGLSSLDETLASSYTADNEAHLQPEQLDTAVQIHVGLSSRSGSTNNASPTSLNEQAAQPLLQVTLLSQADGQPRFAEILSEHTQQQAKTYCSDILLPDIDAAVSDASSQRLSSSSLRKSWVSKRTSLTSQLTAAQLDRTLAQAAYLAEPELLVVWGARPRLRQLYGFPAWPIRLTDLFYDANVRPNKRYGSGDFVSALRKLARTEQRYGR